MGLSVDYSEQICNQAAGKPSLQTAVIRDHCLEWLSIVLMANYMRDKASQIADNWEANVYCWDPKQPLLKPNIRKFTPLFQNRELKCKSIGQTKSWQVCFCIWPRELTFNGTRKTFHPFYSRSVFIQSYLLLTDPV